MSNSATVSDKPILAIGLKVLSVGMFLVMASLVKASGDVPPGEMVFFRSFFAIPPIIIFMWWSGKLHEGVRTSRPLWHMLRGLLNVGGMMFGFYGLTHLPLPEAVSIGYTMPLLTVLFGAVFLKETVRLYRWSAVIIGFVGVAIITGPRLSVFSGGISGADLVAFGALASLIGSTFGAAANLLVRTMVKTEHSATIVFYASITSVLVALCTIPFGWIAITFEQTVMLILAGVIGGIGQVILTESFRYAGVSVIAPFEYVSLIFSILIGYFLFKEVPTVPMMIGSLVVVTAGLFIIFRERQLGLERDKARAITPRM